MNRSVLGSQGLVAAVAVGAGVVIGAAGVFLYEHFFGEKRRLILQKEVTDLGISLSELRSELDTLRSSQRRIKGKVKNSNVSTVESASPAKNFISQDSASRSEGENEVLSVIDDDLEDEFFELSDDDDDDRIITLAEAKKDFTDEKYNEVDELLDGSANDKTKAYGILLDLHEKDDSDPELLWRLAKACHKMTDIMEVQDDREKSQYYLARGVEYAKRCLELAPRSSDAHKWYAVCIGARGKHQGSKEKLKDGIEFKRHVQEALTIKPTDPTLHYLLGRFQFEVASLSWVERKVAGALFGEVPFATYSEAAESLSRAEQLSQTPWKENRLLLAKCHLRNGETETALTWLKKADEVPIISPEDQVADAEIKALKRKYDYQRE